MFELMVESSFDAAHQLRKYEGPCERLHGHSWKVQVFLEGNRLDKLGLMVDFKKLKAILQKILRDFDHHNLNSVKYFKKINPTSENVAQVIYKEFAKQIKKHKVKLSKVTVWESSSTYASYSE